MSFQHLQSSPNRKVHYRIVSSQNINKDMSSSGNDLCSRLENVKLSSQYFFPNFIKPRKTHIITIDSQNSSSQGKTLSTPKKRGYTELSCTQLLYYVIGLRRSYSVDFGLCDLTSYPCKRKIIKSTLSLQQLCQECNCEFEYNSNGDEEDEEDEDEENGDDDDDGNNHNKKQVHHHRCPNCYQRKESSSAPTMSNSCNNPITPISLSDLEQTDEESDAGCFV